MRRQAVVVFAAGAAIAVAGLAAPAQAVTNAPMVLTLTTPTAGTLAALPLDGTVTGITVDWGDGTTTGPYDAPVSAQHTYTGAGAHHVSIAGTKLGHFGSSGLPSLAYTSDLVTQVSSFGGIGITDLSSAFDGAMNLTSVPSSIPPGVTSLAAAFRRAPRFNGPVGGWDTSQVTTMASMFQGAMSFDQPVGAWNTAQVTDMSAMFADIAGPAPKQRWTTVFNQPIGSWNVAKVTDFSWMFAGNEGFDQPLAAWDMEDSPNWAHMFDEAESFDQSLVGWDLSCPGDMSGMFDGAVSLSVPHFSDFIFPSINALGQGCGFHGLGAHDTYVTQVAADGMDAYMAANPGVELDYAGVAELPTLEQSLVLRGDATVGRTLSAATYRVFVGGLPTPTVSFRWQSSADGSSGWVDVPGAGTTSLVVPEPLGGRFLRVVGTASNQAGPDVGAVSWNVLGPVAAIAPAPPRAVRATPRSRAVAVAWSAPASTGGAPITLYRATAVPASGGPVRTCQAAAPTRACGLTGLANGVRYRLTVTATNSAARTSAPSPAVVAVPRTVPGAVRSFTVTRSWPTRTVLRWRAPASTGGSPITAYQVRWRFADSRVWTPWARTRDPRSVTWPGWPWGRVAYAQVRALNAVGPGPAALVLVRR